MSLRSAIYLSLALNAVLLGGWMASLRQPAPLTAAPRFVRTRPAQEPAARSDTRTLGSQAPLPTPAMLRWEDLASENLREYRDHLRQVGCPEATVRDVLRAVINERFNRRRQDFLRPFADRYWDLLTEGEKAFRDIADRLRSMKDERDAVLRDILGDEPRDPAAERASRVRQWRNNWAWLPEPKVAQMVALEEKYQRLEDQLEEEITGRPDRKQTPEDEVARKRLAAEMIAERDALLSESERDELRLREAGATRWAENLYGFEPNEQELRTVGRLQLEAPNQSATELQAKIKALLGEDRYAQYDRARSSEFGRLSRVTDRYGLPADAAVQAFEVRKAALAATSQIRQDATLSETARQAALEAVQRETERALTDALGSGALDTYRRYGGEWVSELGVKTRAPQTQP